jgi:undecaprenyl pyrophosphate phosphatase UppP
MAVILTGLAFAAHARWPLVAPLLVLMLAWLGAMLLIMRRARAKADAELAELDRLTGG